MLHIWLRLPEEDRWDVTTCCRSNQTTPYLYSQRGLWDDGTTACHNETSVSFFFSRLPVRWLVVQLGASSPDIIRKWLTLSITGIKRSGPNRWKHSLFIFLCCFYTLQIRKHKQMNTVLSFDSEKERSEKLSQSLQMYSCMCGGDIWAAASHRLKSSACAWRCHKSMIVQFLVRKMALKVTTVQHLKV